MIEKHSRPASARCVAEGLESRTFLSSVAQTLDLKQSTGIVAAMAVRKAATKTTLAISTGTLAAPVTFTVTVRAAAAAGSPRGTVSIIDHGKVIETIPLAPIASTTPKYAFSGGTATLIQQPGGAPYYFGRHSVSARFVSSGAFINSSVSATFAVAQPTYTALPDGVEYQTVVPGSGVAIQDGQLANVFYSGYVSKTGFLFDDSDKDGSEAFPFTLGGGDVITGFDEGTLGMEVGETRVVLIPPAEGYGSTRNGAIPKNSTLLFVITLESIS